LVLVFVLVFVFGFRSKLEFTPADVYAHAGALAKLHPNNAHVRDKIRQQLQVLRDLGLLEFLGDGNYRLI
jgi:type II restriction enzyme